MSFNLLIVDDSLSMRSVIKKVIAISGFKINECFEARHGKEALEVLEKNWVDIIISDINMPEMNGFELLKALRQDALLRDIPVIVVSTESSEVRVQDALKLGGKGFIKKPFLPEEIRKILYEVVGMDDEEEYGRSNTDDTAFDF